MRRLGTLLLLTLVFAQAVLAPAGSGMVLCIEVGDRPHVSLESATCCPGPATDAAGPVARLEDPDAERDPCDSCVDLPLGARRGDLPGRTLSSFEGTPPAAAVESDLAPAGASRNSTCCPSALAPYGPLTTVHLRI